MADFNSQKKRVFFAPLNWGLGHATRILPLIKYLLKKNFTIYIAASGRSKELLQNEISECVFLDFPAYPIKYPRSRFFVTRFMLVIFPQMFFAMVKEKRKLKNLQKKYKFDLIISDNRFSLASKEVKSILISHQLRYKLPWPIHKMEWLPEYFNYIHFKKYDKIIIPDVEAGQTLTGELSHDMRYLSKEKLYFLGILCDLEDTIPGDDKPIDYFVIISGPEPQRTKFEKLVFRELHKLEGRVVVTLGKPEKKYKIRMGNAEIYTYFTRRDISRYMVRAKLIISRPGYTTVMEMIELGKCGLFIPTPGQIEQEYLAKHFLKNNWCYSTPQHGFEMRSALKNARTFPGFPDNFSRTKENLDKLFREVIDS
jgi:uncharacterized protein (TIGR00661 family)